MTQELKDTLNGVRAAQKVAEVRIINLLSDDYEEDKQIVEELVTYFKRKDKTETQKTVDEILEQLKV